jgi:tRNA modification GTPase
MMVPVDDTIVAPATPPGKGGVGVIRVSGPKATFILQTVTGQLPQPRYATYGTFTEDNGEVIDMGLTLFFPNPHSFTGEDVVEFQGHGGPVVMDRLLRRIVSLGARLARPGEFSERAFLNDKIDLTQAEAIADLIDSASEQAARCAIRSLQGEFSQQVNLLVESLIRLRMYVEAAIDFPEEEVDFLSDGVITNQLNTIITNLHTLLDKAKQGSILREGLTVVIVGKPNAGKSSLLNQLSGKETAIVTDIPGTTRDLIKDHILLDGIPLHIVDTAGLRDSDDPIEQEGIKRARREIDKADLLLLIVDITQVHDRPIDTLLDEYGLVGRNVIIIFNKIDLASHQVELHKAKHGSQIYISAKKGDGMDLLRQHLANSVGLSQQNEGQFIARRRHLDALKRADQLLRDADSQFTQHTMGELLAEDLRLAQQVLSEITGQFTSDDLLGKIFSSFCIGK